MSAVIRLRTQPLQPGRLDASLEVEAARSEPQQIARWPIYLSVIVAIGVSLLLWAGIAWITILFI